MSGFNYASFVSRIITLQQTLDINNAALGKLLFYVPLGLLCMIPFTTYLLHKIESRYLLLTGCIVYTCLLGFIGWIHQVWVLGIALWCFGAARNMMNICLNVQSVGVQALYKPSILNGFHAAWSSASFIGSGVGALMIYYNIATPIHFTGVAIASSCIFLLAFPFTVKKDTPQYDDAVSKTVFKMPPTRVFILGLLAFCCLAVESSVAEWSVIYFKKEMLASKAYLSAGSIAFMAAMAIGRFSGDWIVNRIGVKNILQMNGAFICTGLLLTVIFPNVYVATIGMFFTGFGVSSIMPNVIGLAGKIPNTTKSLAIATVSLVSYIGSLIVAPIVGQIAQTYNLRYSFAGITACGIIIFTVAGILLRVKEKRKAL